MKIDKGKLRAPQIGRSWLNSLPSYFRRWRGRVSNWFPAGVPSQP